MEVAKDILNNRTSQQDEIAKILEEVSNRGSSQSFSGLKFTLYDDSSSSLKQNELFGPLQSIMDQMNHEREQLVTQFRKFYFSKLDYKEYTPQEINSIIQYYLLRIKRMNCILAPAFSVIQFYEKKSKNHYHMVKGYWINDNGQRVRNLSRNVGNTEASMAELVQKFLSANISDIITMELAAQDQGVDFIMYDGKNKWGVEVKFTSRDNFIKTFVIFELWKIYKNEYELLE